MGTEVTDALADVAVYGAALGQVLFVIGWARQAWWTHWVTRAMMFKAVILAVVLCWTCWRRWNGYSTPTVEYGTAEYVGLVLFLLLTAGIWFLTLTLWWHVHFAKTIRPETYSENRFSRTDSHR